MSPIKVIYLDYAAATPTDSRVISLIQKISRESWGNPSSGHNSGKKAKAVLDGARKGMAAILGVKTAEIIFTGSGTESVNLAIFGVARTHKIYGRHIITTKIEHQAVLKSCQYLEANEGFKVTYLNVTANGMADPAVVEKAIRPDTILVSMMYVNNEIGVIQPIVAISKIIQDFRNRKFKIHGKTPFFHVDACQAAGFLNIQPHSLGVDLLTLNGSKIYGPKGAGILYKKNSLHLEPMLVGGSQENGWRAGTENVALAAGLTAALTIAEKEKKEEGQRLTLLRDEFIEKILSKISNARLNGDAQKRLPNNINLSFKGVDGEMLVLALNQHGVEVSTGSACTTGETGPSHVLRAIGHPRGWGNVRITLGRQTKPTDLTEAVKILKKEVARLRSV